MYYDYIKDESGKIIDIKVDGKPVTRGSMRGFKKAQTFKYFRIINRPHTFVNPFSNEEVQLNPLEATIYNFCVAWYERYCSGIEPESTGRNVQVYDDMKYFLLELNPQAYQDLIN